MANLSIHTFLYIVVLLILEVICVCDGQPVLNISSNSGVKLDLGGPCEENSQCDSYAICEGGYCVCEDGYVDVSGKCLRKASLIGDACEHDLQCSSLGVHSLCYESICLCDPTKSFENYDFTKCLSFADKVGDICEIDAQCNAGVPGVHSACMFDGAPPLTCQCKPEAFDFNGRCFLEPAKLGDVCISEEQCVKGISEGSVCVSNICECSNGYIPDPEGASCNPLKPARISIAKPCTDSHQCMGDPGTTSVCTKTGICSCRKGYVSSGKMDDCLVIRNEIGATCTEPQQCQQGEIGALGNCMENATGKRVCNCTNGAINEAEDNMCYMKAKQVGDACIVNAQCNANLEHSQCLNGHCRCFSIAIPSPDYSKCELREGQLNVEDTFKDEL